MKKLLLVFILFCFDAYAYELEPVTDTQFGIQLVLSSMIITDWFQTKKFREENSTESNPILGKEPTQAEVDIYIFSGLALSWIIVYLLPSKYRWIFQSLVFVGEVRAIDNNYKKDKSRNSLTCNFKF